MPDLLWRVDPNDVQVAVINALLVLVRVAGTPLGASAGTRGGPVQCGTRGGGVAGGTRAPGVP